MSLFGLTADSDSDRRERGRLLASEKDRKTYVFVENIPADSAVSFETEFPRDGVVTHVQAEPVEGDSITLKYRPEIQRGGDHNEALVEYTSDEAPYIDGPDQYLSGSGGMIDVRPRKPVYHGDTLRLRCDNMDGSNAHVAYMSVTIDFGGSLPARLIRALRGD